MADETILQSKVPPMNAGLTLLDYLCGRFRYQDRGKWQEAILLGKVTVNGSKADPGDSLKKGDLVAYAVVLKEPAVDKDFRVLHEEETFLVADKPGQLPSHADGNFIKNTFIYLLKESMAEKGWKGEVRLVHRLDRETSGLMVVAKTKEAHRNLTDQFEAGQVEKEYLALVRGVAPEDSFQVDGAMIRDTAGTISIRQKVVAHGTPGAKPSLTKFEVVERFKDRTLLRCVPKTGRTNQIRVHLDHAGLPLVGDKLYGRTDGEFLEFVAHVKAGGDPGFDGRWGARRHLLHAAKLAFTHPVTGARVEFTVDMPADMREYIGRNK